MQIQQDRIRGEMRKKQSPKYQTVTSGYLDIPLKKVDLTLKLDW